MVLAIPSPPSNGVDLGPLEIRFYGLFYVIAVIAAVAITTRRWERQGGSRELVHEVVLWAFPAGLVGARLYYVITGWGEGPEEWWGPLAVWRGGLGVWGGIAMGTLAGVLVLRRRGADVARFMDAAAPALLVAQAIGRLGNYFNQAVRPSDDPAVGDRDRPSTPARPVRRVRDVSPDVSPSGISRSRASWSGSPAAERSVRPDCSRSTSRATPAFGSSRNCCAPTRLATCSDCG
jgi:hypothetical protein